MFLHVRSKRFFPESDSEGFLFSTSSTGAETSFPSPSAEIRGGSAEDPTYRITNKNKWFSSVFLHLTPQPKTTEEGSEGPAPWAPQWPKGPPKDGQREPEGTPKGAKGWPKIAKGIPKDGQREPKGTRKGAKGSPTARPPLSRWPKGSRIYSSHFPVPAAAVRLVGLTPATFQSRQRLSD